MLNESSRLNVSNPHPVADALQAVGLAQLGDHRGRVEVGWSTPGVAPLTDGLDSRGLRSSRWSGATAGEPQSTHGPRERREVAHGVPCSALVVLPHGGH
jgi:hypothetical protein